MPSSYNDNIWNKLISEEDFIIKKRYSNIVGQDEKNRVEKWDLRFLQLAKNVATWSRDPSRQVGSVIVRSDKSIVSLGYNGFARGVNDTTERYENRDQKYELIVHAEVNAVISSRQSVDACTLYSSLYPCSRCAAIIINSGIKRVVSYKPPENDSKVNFDLTTTQFNEAQLEVALY
ncbi:MAG: dCMP deaminase family protein [Candidatus Paceibacterota bacterium]